MNDAAGSPPQSLTDAQTQALAAWEAAAAASAKALLEERTKRLAAVRVFFPDGLNEGTNSHPLLNGWSLKATQPITRDVDADSLRQLAALRLDQLAEAFLEKHNLQATPMLAVEAVRLDLNKLIKWEPALVVKEYRTLTATQLALFDRCLTSKPGMAGLKLNPPPKSTTQEQPDAEAQA